MCCKRGILRNTLGDTTASTTRVLFFIFSLILRERLQGQKMDANGSETSGIRMCDVKFTKGQLKVKKTPS